MNVLLAAVDLQTGSQRVVARAAELAARLKARLHLVHVIDEAMVLYEPMVEISVRRRLQQGATQALQQLVDGLPAGLRANIERHVLLGKPSQTLARKATDLQADLVLAGRQHQEPVQELFLGTTVERLLRHCTMPVLVVTQSETEPYRQLVAATDFSRSSHHALRAGLALAPDAGVSLVHVFEPPLLLGLLRHDPLHTDSLMNHQKTRIEREVKEEMAHFIAAEEHDRIDTRILSGEVKQAITAVVEETRAQLLVLGYHGRQGISRLLVGNLAMSFLSAPPCDVLVAR
ncbi:universal stress protein [Oceanimonas sp. CHS3-5]|uniref:universal stress protein n=1 Tax=Oceanimonas sp. CHS3-5 TaxID=3068186 RepID=UPI00273F84F4|nr:universal stress protein [Oceanimonas sp. CHS3-5]MDP5291729.1 universal stress protein [Oceanimonas sp. CHS3-5]